MPIKDIKLWKKYKENRKNDDKKDEKRCTSVGNFENSFVNKADFAVDFTNKEMVKISWGGKSLEVRNRDSFKTNFYVDDA